MMGLGECFSFFPLEGRSLHVGSSPTVGVPLPGVLKELNFSTPEGGNLL